MVVWRDGERKNITVQLGERNLKASSGKSGSAVEQDAPSIGLSVRPLTKEEARTANVKPGTGLLIVGVEPGKLAAEAELREGDIILSANLKPIKSVEEFSKNHPRRRQEARGRHAPAPASGTDLLPLAGPERYARRRQEVNKPHVNG